MSGHFVALSCCGALQKRAGRRNLIAEQRQGGELPRTAGVAPRNTLALRGAVIISRCVGGGQAPALPLVRTTLTSTTPARRSPRGYAAWPPAPRRSLPP